MTTEAPVKEGEVVDSSRQLAVELGSQRQLALNQPRDEKKIFSMALSELEMAPEFAEDAYYSIPFKSGQETTMIEGLSIKAARAIVRRWSNCALSSRITGEDADAVIVQGIFVDFESNVYFRKEQRVPKTYIPKGTSIPAMLRSDRLQLAIQAGLSKAERNAALAALPEYLKERYFAQAKKIAGSKGKKEGKTVAERLEALYPAFAKYNVSRAQVEAYILANFAKDTDPDELLGTMRGVYNSIKDGQAKADEVFAEVKAKTENGAVKLNDIPGSNL